MHRFCDIAIIVLIPARLRSPAGLKRSSGEAANTPVCKTGIHRFKSCLGLYSITGYMQILYFIICSVGRRNLLLRIFHSYTRKAPNEEPFLNYKRWALPRKIHISFLYDYLPSPNSSKPLTLPLA